MIISLVCIVIFIQNLALGARILCFYPVPSISHQVVFRALTQELARRGHDLVVVTPDPYLPKDRPTGNVREIDLHDLSYDLFRKRLSNLAASTRPPVEDFHNIILKSATEVIDIQLGLPQVKELIQNKSEHFDLLIVESVVRPAYFFTHRFKVPVIGFSSLMGMQYNYDATGTPNNPLLYPDVFQKKIGNLTFWDKWDAIYTDLYQKYAYWRSADEENKIGRKHFGEDTPDIQELVNNMDLLFLNVHPVWDGIRPTPPSVVFVSGLHLSPPKELPKELKSYLDGCTEGVVYMSLGSNIKSSELPAEKLKIFLQVFAELPFCVLWKWENEELPGKPDNVRVEKWLPQFDLLGHHNIRVFITQGGLQSTDEAIDRGVPLVGIPFMADQQKNVQKYVYHGVGTNLDIRQLSTDGLRDAVLSIIHNESYRKNIERLKKLMYDQPSSALDRAVWWVEYLLRHGSARHLRSPGAGSGFSCWPLVALAVAALSLLAHTVSILQSLYTHLSGGQTKKNKMA